MQGCNNSILHRKMNLLNSFLPNCLQIWNKYGKVNSFYRFRHLPLKMPPLMKRCPQINATRESRNANKCRLGNNAVLHPFMATWLCGSKKYPYRKYPPGNSSLASYFPLKFLAIEIPLPLRISNDHPWVGVDIFWNCTFLPVLEALSWILEWPLHKEAYVYKGDSDFDIFKNNLKTVFLIVIINLRKKVVTFYSYLFSFLVSRSVSSRKKKRSWNGDSVL